MIEVIYNENSQDKKDKVKNLRLPKNVRQIGDTGEDFKVYLEDYVNTFLKQLTEKDVNRNRVVILMGEHIKTTSRYLFISGAIYIEEIVIDGEGVHFTDAIWSRIYENVKEYFDHLEIVGWYLSVPGFPIEVTTEITKVHINQFAGSSKVLMMNEPIEGEERFFYYENGTMKSVQGYYIYYEKNNAMQTYMIEHRNEKEEEEILQAERETNSATRQFRNIVQEKQEEIQRRKMTSFMYTVSSVLVMIVLVIGITMMNNYDKMNNMEKSLAILTKNSIEDNLEVKANEVPIKTDESVTVSNEKFQTVAVETISGNVEKVENMEIVENVETAQEKIEVQNVQDNKTQPAEEKSKISDGIVEEPVKAEETIAKSMDEPAKENVKDKKETETDPVEIPEEQTESEKTKETKEEAEETKETKPEEPAKEASEKPDYYVIQEGDTLAEISIRVYHTKEKVSAICEANGIEDIDKIFVGQKILLP